jgi:hypothetical protein
MVSLPPSPVPSSRFCRALRLLRLGILAIFWVSGGWISRGIAHPTPDLPVRSSFTSSGECLVEVEVTPRLFDEDPEKATPLTVLMYEILSDSQKEDLKRKAAALVPQHVEFFFEPLGQMKPDFRFEFTGEGFKPIGKGEDVVVLSGRWRTSLPAGLTGWKVRAVPQRLWSVVFQNVIDGQVHPRLEVLFPGETSYTLDLTRLAKAERGLASPGAVSPRGEWSDTVRTFGSFWVKGFTHVVPHGLDHLLFVLGVFLLSRSWGALLWQVSSFTLAHSVTLALSAVGVVRASASWVEPLISASIVAVAIENLFHARYTRWRLLVVFGFGLVHGLGFAGALQELSLPAGSFVAGLVGFNFGVEGGQLAVLALAGLATFWIRDPAVYRRWVVVPGSLLIAAAGAYWTWERLVFGS